MCYQVVFKVIKANFSLFRVAPILTEGHCSNNAPGEVIHRLHERESWVFHNIHIFRTILDSVRWNTQDRPWKVLGT